MLFADVVLPRLSFPDWTVTLLIVVAIAAFPVALALAWFYDVVPAASADDAREGVAPRARAAPRWVAAGAVAAVLVIAAGVSVRVWPELMDDSAPIESIAVLPFDNLSADPEQEYFVAGMHDALITELAQIGSVRVLSRNSTMRPRRCTLRSGSPRGRAPSSRKSGRIPGRWARSASRWSTRSSASRPPRSSGCAARATSASAGCRGSTARRS